jgi:hypothetical protein
MIKKTVTRFRILYISKNQALSLSIGNLQISSFAQETMCRFGQSVVFEEASSLINSLTGCVFNAKQVERVCHLYGGLLDEKMAESIARGESKVYSEEEKLELHYAMIDGAMYPTKSKEEP